MAKPELIDHRKFLKLRRLLGAPTPHVLGYLECLWRRGYQTGNPHIGDADDVEAAAEFPGERGAFTTAALAAGFLEADKAGEFSIHDLYEHAPGYAKKRMHRVGTAPADAKWSSISDGEHLHGSQGKREKRKSVRNRPNGQLDAVGDQSAPPVATTDGISTANHPGQKSSARTQEAGELVQNSPSGQSKAETTPKRTTKPKAENQEPKTEKINPLPADAGEGAAEPSLVVVGGKLRRSRNELFDAVAEVSGADPTTAGGLIATTAAALAKANPPYTAGDVREFAGRFWELCPWAATKPMHRPTPGTITNHIGLLRAPPPPKQQPPPKPHFQTQDERTLSQIVGALGHE